MKNSEMSPLKHPYSVSAENKKSSEILHLGNRHENTRIITLTLKIVRGVPKKMSDFPFISIRKKKINFVCVDLSGLKLMKCQEILDFIPFIVFNCFSLTSMCIFTKNTCSKKKMTEKFFLNRLHMLII